MTPQEFQNILQQTLDDQLISRGERRALQKVITEIEPTEANLDLYRHAAFDLARNVMPTALDKSQVLDWLEDVVKMLKPLEQTTDGVTSEAFFSPGDEPRHRIRSLLRQAKFSVDICVFTITDDEISEVIAETHNRRVAVRIITDDNKATDTGSDIERLQCIGIPVAYDDSPFHMHHKFALFDDAISLCGSYNWTRSAAENNEENIVITNDPQLAKTFRRVFNKLWTRYSR